MHRRRIDPLRLTDLFQSGRDAVEHLPPRHFGAVQVQAEMREPFLLQPLQDGFQRRPLLCDEQDLLAPRTEFTNQIGDGLALAGAWRPADDTIPADKCAPDGGLLRRVRVKHQDS